MSRYSSSENILKTVIDDLRDRNDKLVAENDRLGAAIDFLREVIQAMAEELEADIPYDAGNDHCHYVAKNLRSALEGFDKVLWKGR